MNKKIKILLKDTVIFALGGMGSKFILFFLVPLYTNYLTTGQYGTAELVITVAQLIMPIITLEIFDAVIRFGMIKDIKRENVILIGVIITLINSFVLLFLTPLFDLYIAIAKWKWYLSIYVISYSFNTLGMNCLKVKGKNRSYALISIFQTLILCLSNIVLLVYLDLGIEGYLLSNIISMVLSCLIILKTAEIIEDIIKASFEMILLKKMLFFSIPLILNNISWWLIHSTDKIMIQMMIDVSACGIYTVATKMPSLINVVVSVFSQSWGISSIKEIETSNDNKFYTQVFKMFTFVIFGICIVINSIIRPFMNVYVGSSFNNAWRYVPLLMVAAVFYSISSFYGSIYIALKKTISSTITTLISATINILINYFFIQTIGVWGAILGTLTAYFVMSQIRINDVNKYININIDWIKYGINVMIILIQAVFISLNISLYIISIMAIVLFIINNKLEFKSLIQSLVCIVK
ncbi:polysaccharide biosynthesis C-terminal domain-containing protein [Thomasclavelia sp.]|uniref:oligosaccharide flippase family protein n=1 Tax=Thomasclavelia sp. TaxID=3025757 RepID=UPI0025D88237|nr:polysaccharide biosynthesis C-terminal domain-containing protein [Thomasclavelia sp.]